MMIYIPRQHAVRTLSPIKLKFAQNSISRLYFDIIQGAVYHIFGRDLKSTLLVLNWGKGLAANQISIHIYSVSSNCYFKH